MAVSTSRDLVGSTGRRYVFKKTIQERPHFGRIGNDNFILKDVPPNLTDDLLSLLRKQIPTRARKQIPKTSLQGIAEMHDRDIVHLNMLEKHHLAIRKVTKNKWLIVLDIKPDNILVNYRHVDQDIVVEQVQVSDLENAAYLPPPRYIKGMLASNENWRSPEGYFKGELNKSSDLYSFGPVCIYAILGRVILGSDDDFKLHESKGALPAFIRLQRQISYCEDREGLDGLMKHVDDEEMNCEVLGMFWEERTADYVPYVPFSKWTDVDSTLKGLILGLMSLNPLKRFTARQALDHPWFEGIEIV